MIVVRCKGGLGNQLFQYATGRALAVRLGAPLLIDTTWYDSVENIRPVARTFDLDAFRIEARLATPAELVRIRWPPPPGLWRRRWAAVRRRCAGWRVLADESMGRVVVPRARKRHTMLEGYFQHPGHFEGMEERLRAELIPRDEPPSNVRAFGAHLAADTSVCLQVRRQDFVQIARTAAVHGCVDSGFYSRAWARLKHETPGARGYVFADDPEWAREFFAGWPDVKIVSPEFDGPRFLHRFWLMQRCRHFIIMNSTWGWWAAWLGQAPGSRVLLPDSWLRGRSTKELGLVCPGWETVEAAG